MSRHVRLVRWRVAQAGVLGSRSIEIGPLGPGVNVIEGPNECGKSTMMRALRAALFERWSFRGQSVRELQPHGTKLGPQVEVDFEVDGVLHRLRKQLVVSPSAQLTIGDDPRVITNDEADAHVRAALEAHEGNKQGSSTDDMGLWGLLWVRQDEYATREPAASLGNHVRADLDSIIDQQTGQVLGGAEGVALREAIAAEYQKYFTPKREEASGELAAARTRVEALQAIVTECERALADSEALSDEIQRLESRLAEHTDRAAELRRELTLAEAAVVEATAVQRELDDAEQALRDATELVRQAEEGWRRRGRRLGELAEVERLVAQEQTAIQKLRDQADDVRRGLENARHLRDGAARDYELLRERSEACALRLECLQLDGEIEQKGRDLADGQRWSASVQALQQEMARLPDDARLREVEALYTRCERLRAQAEHGATRVTLLREGCEPRTEVIVRSRELDLGSLGRVEIEPARSGFIEVRARWRAAQDRLRSLLTLLRATSVGEVRARADAASQRYSARARVLETLAQLAPSGLGALRDEFTRAEREQQDALRARDEARRASERLAQYEAELAALATDPSDEREARSAAARLESLAQSRASGIHVRVRALGDVRVVFGPRGGAPRTLAAGEELARDVVEAFKLVFDDRLEVEIDPGHLTAQAASRYRLQDELAKRFAALGVESIEALDDKCALRSRQEGARDDLARQLATLCPGGLSVLEERVERLRRMTQALRERLDKAQSLDAELASMNAGVDGDSLTPTAWEELRALDQEALSLELEARRVAPRVLRAQGEVAQRLSIGELVDELAITIDGARVVIAPGESVADVELPLLEQRLRGELERLQASSVEDVRRLHHRFIECAARSHADAAALARVAPSGLSSLEIELTGLRSRRARMPESQPVAESRDALSAMRTSLQHETADAQARLRIADESVARRERELRDAAAVTDSAEAGLLGRQVELRALAQSLAEERSVQPDTALEEAFANASTKRATCEARLAEVRLRAELAGLARRREAVGQWQDRIKDHDAEYGRTRDALLRRQGELDEIRRQGRYDALQEKRLELEGAQLLLRRLEEKAAATRLLWSVAQAEYATAEDRLLMPVRKAAAELLPYLWPGSALELDRDSWQVRKIVRGGTAETFDALSGGAREQLAIIVRIALARVLARERAAMPLILDDVLGWTDDERLRQMLGVLERAAQNMQVIVLTCHPRRFERFVGANRFDVRALAVPT